VHNFSIRTLGAALLLYFAVGSSPVAAGSAADLATVIAALEGGYARLTDLQADFSQRTTISSLKREEKGSGELFIKKPAGGTPLFRFNYVKPRQQIICNGKTVWYFLPDNNQVIETDTATLFKGGNGVALSYLTGMGHVSRDFTVTFMGEGRDPKGNYLLELTPKNPTPLMAKLQLTLSKSAVEKFVETGSAQEPFPIVSSVVIDAGGNRTHLFFSKIKANRGMSNSRFSFKSPAGVDVIKQ
jgi:outer membrane lipoprotein carrier protein